MDWQELASLVIVACTAGAFVWNALRTRKLAFQKKTGCGCHQVKGVHRGSVVVTGRRGQTAQVIFRQK